MRSIIIVVIPSAVYESGEKKIMEHIEFLMAPYSENTEIEPYVIVDKDKIDLEYDENKEDYKDINELCEKFYGGYLNEDGCVVSTLNKNAFWDTYEIIEKEPIMYDIEDDVTDAMATDTLMYNCYRVSDLNDAINSGTFECDIILCDTGITKKNNVLFYGKLRNLNKDDYYVKLDCNI